MLVLKVEIDIKSVVKEYGLVKDIELGLVERKLKKEEAEMKKNGVRYLPKEKALGK